MRECLEIGQCSRKSAERLGNTTEQCIERFENTREECREVRQCLQRSVQRLKNTKEECREVRQCLRRVYRGQGIPRRSVKRGSGIPGRSVERLGSVQGGVQRGYAVSKEECREVWECPRRSEQRLRNKYHRGVYREDRIRQCLRRSAMRLGIYTKEECIERLGSVQGEGNEMF